ncbi:MAG: hypothetical protein AMS19_14860 [Gemmatimonas sp. SG8_23]|nr:MAG: hypothetical protein AMS19_14860 [Gemmatimonas sp. SG8_23]
MPRKKPDLDAFLSSSGGAPARRVKRCRTCNELPHLAALVKEFMDRKASGELAMSFGYFYEEHVSRRFDISQGALRNHVVRCLRRDLSTGRPR